MTTLTFLYLLPISVVVYYLCSFSRPLQNGVLLLLSLALYSWGQSWHLLLLLLCILWNHCLGLALGAKRLRGLLWLAVGGNLLPLVAFGIISRLPSPWLLQRLPLAWRVPAAAQVVVPLGLSVYTLQATGYLLDVYRGKIPPEKNPLYLGLYLSFFPQLVSGVLMGFAEMRQQMAHRQHSAAQVGEGVCRFVVGLAKKLLLADGLFYLSHLVQTWSSMDDTVLQIPVTLAWLGLIAYGLRLYYELSGFADMAIGLGKVFGFTLPENFRHPLAATSLTDFWQRWNITGLGWFRGYLFGILPRRDSQDRTLLDLFLVWMLFGLWHGLSWNHLFWGIWNFVILLVEYFLDYSQLLRERPTGRLYTLLVWGMGLVLLWNPSIYSAGQYYTALLGLGNNSFYGPEVLVFLREYWAQFAFGALFALPALSPVQAWLARQGRGMQTTAAALYPVAVVGLLVLCLSSLIHSMAVFQPVL